MNILLFLTPKKDVSYLYSDYTIRQATEKMEYHRYTAIPIIDRNGKYIGTLTEGDILWFIKNNNHFNLQEAENEKRSSQEMVMGAYARKHSRYHRSVECETDGALQILWNLWELHRFAKILQICETGVMEKQETQRPNVLADVEEIYEYSKDTSTGVSKDISEKCVLGKWLIEEPYALIGHVRFCEGLLRLEPLIAKQYMMKGCEKVETKSTRRLQ